MVETVLGAGDGGGGSEEEEKFAAWAWVEERSDQCGQQKGIIQARGGGHGRGDE